MDNRKKNDKELNVFREKVDGLESENTALRSEVKNLSNQLAQRAILYAAQERRYLDDSRKFSSLHSEVEMKLITLQGNYDELSKRFQICDKERLEAIMASKEYQSKSISLEEKIKNLEESMVLLDSDLSAASHQNNNLQLLVERLRNHDEFALPDDFSRSVINSDSYSRSNNLELQRRIDSLTSERTSLIDTIKVLETKLSSGSSSSTVSNDKLVDHSRNLYSSQVVSAT